MLNLEQLHEKYFDRSHCRDDASRWSERSTEQGVVTSANYLASAAGAQILAGGGNAMDAAIATSFALAVCEPAGSGLGGMATMVIFDAREQRVVTVEGPCRAPRAADPKKVAESGRYRGYPAIAVPSHVATMNYLHQHYGSLPISSLLEPAIQLAQEGFPVTATLHGLMGDYAKALRKRSAGVFFLQNGEPIPVGQQFRQPVLAETLTRLSRSGLMDFYHGEVGRRIVHDLRAGGGFIDLVDFQDPPQPLHREPIQGAFGDSLVHTVGPPGGGMTLIQLGLLFTAARRESLDLQDPADVVLLAKLIQLARKQRQKYRLKSGADSPAQAARLLDGAYNRSLLAQLQSENNQSSNGETTHVCVMDKQGNAVSLTQSIERSFGSCIVTPDLGFCYNGYLRAFKVENQRHPYYLRPGVPARSNAAPTIVTGDGRPRVLIGSTGSERMISGIFCTLLRLMREEPFAAGHGPRLHCTPDGTVILEGARFPESVSRELQAAGFMLDVAEAYAFRMGGLQLLVVDESGARIGVADPRRDGAAICG